MVTKNMFSCGWVHFGRTPKFEVGVKVRGATFVFNASKFPGENARFVRHLIDGGDYALLTFGKGDKSKKYPEANLQHLSLSAAQPVLPRPTEFPRPAPL